MKLHIASLFCLALTSIAQVPFTIQGPDVDPSHFRVTTFASDINYVLGMAQHYDGSIIAAVTDGPSFFNSNGRLVRFVDTDGDGVADHAGATLVTGLQGGLTSVRISGNLLFVTGQKKPITIFRLDQDAPPTRLAQIDFTYPAGSWLHPHSALAVRGLPTGLERVEVIFQIGSRENFTATPETATVSISSPDIKSVAGQLKGDSIYKMTFVFPGGSQVELENMTQIATGLRNASGFAFHPRTGDFYFEDNGIDGVVNANEPTSADELNMIPLSQFGGEVENFGFPGNYTEYRTGRFVGGGGLRPLVSFLPLPNPADGMETEGPNDIEFSPASFPDALANGVFVTFHGKFNAGGAQNEENGMAFVNLSNNSYFHFIQSRLPGVGHLDGLLATQDSIFISDLSKTGNLTSSTGTGVIYQIKALVGPRVHYRRNNDGKIELTWASGLLERATSILGPWTVVSFPEQQPYRVTEPESPQFFRTRN